MAGCTSSYNALALSGGDMRRHAAGLISLMEVSCAERTCRRKKTAMPTPTVTGTAPDVQQRETIQHTHKEKRKNNTRRKKTPESAGS